MTYLAINQSINRLNGSGTGAMSPLAQALFFLPMEDLGAGVVNTTLSRGVGSPTFTRATIAWTRLASGLWAQVASGVPRSYYLSDGTYAGYLAEGARTNLTLHSNDFTNAAWVKSNMTSAKTATGPDGVANSASTLTATAANGTALQAITSGSSSRIASVFIKRRTGTGTVNITQDNGSTWTAVTVTADWTQVPSTNQTLTNPTVGIRVVTSGDAVDVWCFMNEVGTFASTPIPTTTATVTRNADVLTYDFSGNALATAGACYAELGGVLWTTSPAGINSAAVSFVNGIGGAPLYVAAGQASTTTRVNDGATAVSKSGLTDLSTGVRKRWSTWGGSSMSVTGDGATVASGTFDGNLGSTAVAILCGTGGSDNWFGAGKNIRLWQRELSSSIGQSLTA